MKNLTSQKGLSTVAIIVVVVVILIAAVVIYFVVSDSTNDNTNVSNTNTTTNTVTNTVANANEVMEETNTNTSAPGESEVSQLVMNDPAAQQTAIIAVDGSPGSGTAYRLWKNETLSHYVQASLQQPATGSSYEGWLVQSSPVAFFSTGVMTDNGGGIYTLEYTSEQEYPTYLQVVITEETVVDETPETHVLEGTF
ncbi:anti-sigma factor [Patescibacteria group bacterium]